MELITEYIKPELIVVAVVLYIVGIGLKKTTVVKTQMDSGDSWNRRYFALRHLGICKRTSGLRTGSGTCDIHGHCSGSSCCRSKYLRQSDFETVAKGGIGYGILCRHFPVQAG